MKKTVIIVTGAGAGLGCCLVDKIISNTSFVVCAVDYNKNSLDKLMHKYGNRCICCYGSVSDETFVIDTIETLKEQYEIFALINNAGSPSFKMPDEYTSRDIDICFEGLKGMILFTSNVLKVLNEDDDCRIINIMSSASLRGNKRESVYCAVKWGERGYTESLRDAYPRKNIRIYAIYPGGINTNFYSQSRDYVSLEKQNTFMDPKDVAEVIFDNVFCDKKLIVEDIIINRVKK